MKAFRSFVFTRSKTGVPRPGIGESKLTKRLNKTCAGIDENAQRFCSSCAKRGYMNSIPRIRLFANWPRLSSTGETSACLFRFWILFLCAHLMLCAQAGSDGNEFMIREAYLERSPIEGAMMRLEWNAEAPLAAGERYLIEATDHLTTGSWKEVKDVVITANNTEGEATVPVEEETLREFYRVRISAGNPVSSGFVLVPAGSFQMGDSLNEGGSDERPVHEVTVGAFLMQTKETTKAEWDDVYDWALDNGYTFFLDIRTPGGKGPEHPVHSVSWYGAVKWCNARSEKEGLAPCYYTDESRTQVYRRGEIDVSDAMVDWNAGGYRLPTEAEWEKAARGGVSGKRFPWGDTISHSHSNYYSSPDTVYDTSPTQGNHPDYDDGNFPYTSPVGSFAPNGYGLYDMAGNVFEWCWDWYGSDYYSSSPPTDPLGPETMFPVVLRVFRGGGWGSPAAECRIAYRSNFLPVGAFTNIGFRPVRTQ